MSNRPNDFEKRILNQIPRCVRGHPIVIALSGSKDSTTMLHVLHKYQQKLRITRLAAIILEEEIPEVQLARKKVIKQLEQNYPDINFIQKSHSRLSRLLST